MNKHGRQGDGHSLLARTIRFAACSIAVVLFLLEIPLLPRAFSHAGEVRLLMYALPAGCDTRGSHWASARQRFSVWAVGSSHVDRRARSSAFAVVSTAVSITMFTSLLPAAEPGRSRIRITGG